MVKYTNEEVLDVIENEGLEYAITGYLSLDSIENPKLTDLFKQIKRLYDEVELELDKIREELDY